MRRLLPKIQTQVQISSGLYSNVHCTVLFNVKYCTLHCTVHCNALHFTLQFTVHCIALYTAEHFIAVYCNALQVVRNHASGRGDLCPKDLERMKAWTFGVDQQQEKRLTR